MIYLTRDSTDGELDDMIDIWAAKPIRVRDGDHVIWRPGIPHTLVKIFYFEDCVTAFGLAPQSDSEIIPITDENAGKYIAQ